VNQPPFVSVTNCNRQCDGESEELSDLHRLPDQAVYRLASCVSDNKDRLSALAD
jgi:hypothetical protein